MPSNMESSGVESANVAVNMAPYIMIAGLVLVIILLLLIVAVVMRKTRMLIKDKLKKMKETMVWNGIIRSISIGFLAFALSVLVILLEMIRCD